MDWKSELERTPRVSLVKSVTPLEECPNLAQDVGVASLYVKRDDVQTIGGGGNKLRKLEFLLADALNKGCNTIITMGGPQSNHARLTAICANLFGLRSILVLGGEQQKEYRGNLLLDNLAGAKLVFCNTHDLREIEEKMEHVASETPGAYVIPSGGATPLGAFGYLKGFVELLEQASYLQHSVDRIVLAVGSGGTFAGLLLGKYLTRSPIKITGISVSRTVEEIRSRVTSFVAKAAELLGQEVLLPPEEVDVYDNYIGPGYGIPSDDSIVAIKKALLKEGFLLDPIYTGKAFAGLCGLVKRGVVGHDESVVFLHTGGSPAIFSFSHRELTNDLN